MKIITLSQQEFDKFASAHKYKNYYQTSSYGNLMSKHGYKVHYIGIIDSTNHLVGASLLLYTTVFMNKKIAYAPGGILFDYNIAENIVELVKKLRNVLGKQDFILLRMDPYIPATIRNKRGLISNINSDVNNILKNIKYAGFKYKGQNNFFENERGRFESIVLLSEKTIKDVYLGFNKRTRHKINKASNSGVLIVEDTNKKAEFLQDIISTNKRSKEYYDDFMKAFGNKAKIYYAVLDTNAYVTSIKKAYEHEMELNEKLTNKIQDNIGTTNQRILNSKMESDKLLSVYKDQLVFATNILEKYPKSVLIGGAITLEYNEAIYLIAEGYDKRYKSLNSNYLTRWFIINEAIQKGYKYLNLNNIVGDFKNKNPYSTLNENKLGFGSIPTEYIGEFDLVLDQFNYRLYQNFSKEKDFKFKDNIK
ncbi:MAG: peptidoglycan bridge formation glycyltransferase FemA/FemB family protein [Bacilli bacterium]|nr:peptidoglycan bridge formation glycyltransferase FemA/FemB family protein [Bacilli bacterium]